MTRKRWLLAILHGIAGMFFFAWRRGTWAPPGPPSAETLRQDDLDQQFAAHRAEEEARRQEVRDLEARARLQVPQEENRKDDFDLRWKRAVEAGARLQEVRDLEAKARRQEKR